MPLCINGFIYIYVHKYCVNTIYYFSIYEYIFMYTSEDIMYAHKARRYLCSQFVSMTISVVEELQYAVSKLTLQQDPDLFFKKPIKKDWKHL